MRLLWLTDLHLDRAPAKVREQFYFRLNEGAFDAAVITGDISCGHGIEMHLAEIARATVPKMVYFVLGNHDFYRSTFANVQRRVEVVCARNSNLRQLGHGEIIPLGKSDALIGHQGWADGRAGWGARSLAHNPDFQAIGDFRGLSKEEAFEHLKRLGNNCAKYFRGLLPYALTCHRHVWIATHVPPFSQAALYDGQPCDRLRQPFFANIAAGGVICSIGRKFLDRRLTVICGHTHSRSTVRAAENIDVLVGAARPGTPDFQHVFSLN
jgi:3',5'-cyclic AMP phosphodiesterase CpdA